MNKADWVEGLLFAGIRLMSVACVGTGLIGAAFQLTGAWDAFDPSYLGSFLAATLLRPAILILAGAALYGLSGTLSRRMAARYRHH